MGRWILGTDFFNGADRHAGHGERNAVFVGCARGLHLAAAAVHARAAHWATGPQGCSAFRQTVRCWCRVAHVLEHALAQGHGGKVVHIAAQRLLGIGAAVVLVEQEGGRELLRCCAVVGAGRDDHDGFSGFRWVATLRVELGARSRAGAWNVRAGRGVLFHALDGGATCFQVFADAFACALRIAVQDGLHQRLVLRRRASG